MLQQKLIELIDKGAAEYKTYCTGGSGTAFLQVPKNHHIIITKFSYSHFLDTKAANLVTLADADNIMQNAAIHNVMFQSNNKRFIYCFRTNVQFNQYIPPLPATPVNTFAILNDTEQIETYQKHTSDINISIYKFHNIGGWVIVDDVPSNNSNSENLPAGYGSTLAGGVPTVQSIVFSPGGAQYLPLADVGNVAPNANYRKEFRDNIDFTTGILDINQVIPIVKPYTFPIMNIEYLVIKDVH